MAGKRYVPLSVHFAHGRTGTALMEELGPCGLLVWVCLIAAAKRSLVPGQYTHLSDKTTWEEFGLLSHPPEFTFDEFLSITGRLNQTRRTRHGRLLYVTLTRFGDWNKEWGTQQSSLQKSRKRAESRADIDRTDDGHDPDTTRTEYEVEVEVDREVEVEKEKKPRARKAPAPPSPVELAVEAVFGKTSNREEAKWRKRDVAAIAESLNGTPPEGIEDELRRRKNNLIEKWGGGIPVTAKSLAKWWSESDTGALVPKSPKSRGESIGERAAASRAATYELLGLDMNGNGQLSHDIELTALEETNG